MSTFLDAIRSGLHEAILDPKVVLISQLGKYGLGGLTTGLFEKRPEQVLTYPVAENLMNASAMGLALAGMRPIVIHERMDFLAVGMDALVNHIPVWPKREPMDLPVTILAVVGRGKGQGPQHSKNLTGWFRNFDGWKVIEPRSPEQARAGLLAAVFGVSPTLYVCHREAFGLTDSFNPRTPYGVGLCGASERHEAEFYGRV